MHEQLNIWIESFIKKSQIICRLWLFKIQWMTDVLLFGIHGSMHASDAANVARQCTEDKETDHFYVIGKINLIHDVLGADNKDIYSGC